MSSRSEFKDYIFSAMAEQLGALSTCPRGAVGAIITRAGRCVSWGFNGAPPGMPHCDDLHGWEYGWEVEEKGCRNVTHAEANALAYAARQGISTEGGTCYVTLSPCVTCARLLVAAGISRVVYTTEYRLTDGIDLLREAGVQVG